MRGRALLLCVASIGSLASCESSTDGTYYDYVAYMHPMKENPAITTAAVANAKGDFTANLDGDVLTYTFRYSGLSGNATLAHIHGPAVQTANAGVIVNFDDATNGRTITLGATSGTASGTISLAASTTYGTAPNTFGGDSLRKLLDNGRLYVNVHTATNGGGEIRGQIVH